MGAAILATRKVNASQDLPGLKYELEMFRLGGAFQLREDSSLVGTLDPEKVSVDVAYGKLIFSCWDEGWSKSWRVVSGEIGASGATLACTRKIGIDRCMLTLDRAGPRQTGVFSSSPGFGNEVRSLIESYSPNLRVERIQRGRDDRSRLSGSYLRLTIKDRLARDASFIAGIAVEPDKAESVVDGALAAGLIWADALRNKGCNVTKLFVFLPRGRASVIANRLTALSHDRLPVYLYEFDEAQRWIAPLSPFDQGDLSDNLRRPNGGAIWPEDLRSSAEIDCLVRPIVSIAPEFIETRSKDGGVTLSIRGLSFAVLSGEAAARDANVYFGLGGDRKRLSAANFDELRRLIWRVISERTGCCRDRNSEIYRAQPERWLESVLRNQADVIDPNIDPGYVYCQVPACGAEHHDYIDLLAATRSGRLVIIELKTAEDPDFPFQGLDYWLRVSWHARRGDFERRGYFPGLALGDEPPLVYLVAPLFRFHWSTSLIASTISESIPVWRIGINDDWRAGVRVLLRERLN